MQHNLGEVFEFAGTVCRIALDAFPSMMISSGAAARFEHGSPKYLFAMHGTELVLDVPKTSLSRRRPPFRQNTTVRRNTVPAGSWHIFQRDTGRSFQCISKVPSMREILRLYPARHDVSEDRAVEPPENIILKKAARPSAGKKRKNCKLTQ